MARGIAGSGIDLVIIANGSQLFTKEQLMSKFADSRLQELGCWSGQQAAAPKEHSGSFF